MRNESVLVEKLTRGMNSTRKKKKAATARVAWRGGWFVDLNVEAGF